MQDELIILGSGGGRHHIRTQYRATGGILYKFNGSQTHIDPGPGALVRINQYGEDPLQERNINKTQHKQNPMYLDHRHQLQPTYHPNI